MIGHHPIPHNDISDEDADDIWQQLDRELREEEKHHIKKDEKYPEFEPGNTKLYKPASTPEERDPITQQHFNNNVTADIDDKAREASQAIWGRQLEPHEWGSLIGAPDGSHVLVRGSDPFGNGSRYVHIDNGSVTGHDFSTRPATQIKRPNHPWIDDMGRGLHFNPDDPKNRLVIENEAIALSPQGEAEAPDGFGTRIIAHQLQGCRRLGVSQFHCHSLNPGWERMGFKGILTASHRKRLPPEYQSAKNTHQLYRMPGALDWNKRTGNIIDMGSYFDTSPRSMSSRIFNKYMARKGIRLMPD
jgi:hypothetical protein